MGTRCRLRLVLSFLLCVGASLGASSRPDATIRIWTVGSPHHGDTPAARIPVALQRAARQRGLELSVEAFPADGFARVFREALARNSAPDVLVIDNYGTMDGITTSRGKFEGVAEDPAVRRHFVRVTGAFDDLRGPRRGWTFLFSLSPSHDEARSLALRPPACRVEDLAHKAAPEWQDVIRTATTAYLNGDVSNLAGLSDPERISIDAAPRERITARAVLPCAGWGNDKLAFANAIASYEGDATVGHASVALVLRKADATWQVLAIGRDPISNERFVNDSAVMSDKLTRSEPAAAPVPASLVAPRPGEPPRPARGQRFGGFIWRSSTSDDVIGEIAEFAYRDDVRLFVMPPSGGGHSQLSAGSLWTTRSEWRWRIWSVSRSGVVAFSEIGTFPH